MNEVLNITLNDGNVIPQLGFGVFQIEPKNTVEAVSEALRIGYRHIDTAEMYGNERELGEAIRASGFDRGDVFVTSKLSSPSREPRHAHEAFDRTLSDLGFDYVDLFLIHWPFGRFPGFLDFMLRPSCLRGGRLRSFTATAAPAL